MTLYGGVIGGAAAGGALGVYFYGDAQLRRLSKQHLKDEFYSIETQLYK